jgi:hypothetical protein
MDREAQSVATPMSSPGSRCFAIRASWPRKSSRPAGQRCSAEVDAARLASPGLSDYFTFAARDTDAGSSLRDKEQRVGSAGHRRIALSNIQVAPRIIRWLGGTRVGNREIPTGMQTTAATPSATVAIP